MKEFKVGDIITLKAIICSKTETLGADGVSFSYKVKKVQDSSSYNTLEINETEIEGLWLPRGANKKEG
jgi:hypothetical protein